MANLSAGPAPETPEDDEGDALRNWGRTLRCAVIVAVHDVCVILPPLLLVHPWH
jgi:hypothetical protein